MHEEATSGDAGADSLTARLARTLVRFPQSRGDLETVSDDVVVPTELRGQGALGRQLLAAIAPHLKDPVLRDCAARIGAWSETHADLDVVAGVSALLWREGEECIAALMLDALTPDGRWHGIDQLAPAIHSEAAANALTMVWHSLPRRT